MENKPVCNIGARIRVLENSGEYSGHYYKGGTECEVLDFEPDCYGKLLYACVKIDKTDPKPLQQVLYEEDFEVIGE